MLNCRIALPLWSKNTLKSPTSVSHPVKWVVVGRFGRPQGLKGLVRVISFTDPVDNILGYSPWYVSKKNQWHPVRINTVESNNKYILVQIDGHEQREQAGLLTNCEIAVKADLLPTLPDHEYYWHDLIGMQVVNHLGEKLGEVTSMLATGSNDVLIVSGEKRHLIPYILGEYVTSVDKKGQLITVNWDMDF